MQLQIFEWSGKNNVQEFACHGFFNIFQYLFACSENISAVDIPDDRKESPSLVVPVISSSPKLETPAVVLAAYLPRFDYRSAVTMFGTQALYTTTHSRPGRLFTKAYFREDKHRLFTIAGGGKIRNDCENYLNTGHPVQDNDESRVLFGQESRVR